MAADEIDPGILRRWFVAIATSAYDDPHWRTLPARREAETLAGWFCGETLPEDQRFMREYPELADNPTEQQIRDALQEPAPGLKWVHSDAAVVYITGHGMREPDGHWLALQKTGRDAYKATALRTADIVGWLAETDIEHLLIIIDTCYAGDVARGIVSFKEPLPETWLMLASAERNEEAKPFALTDAILQALTELSGGTGGKFAGQRVKYLPVQEFTAAVNKNLGDAQRLVILPGSQTSGQHACLPNPKYQLSPAVPTGPPRRDLALPKTELNSHWSTPGWLFSGRAGLMRTLIAAATGEPGATLVTGSAGTGKSAVLARLVTLSDPEFRLQYADKIALIPQGLTPPEGAVDVAVLATGKGATEIMTQICHATGALDESVRKPSLDVAQQAWKSWLRQGEKPVTLVIDALDEASNTDDVLAQVLRKIEGPGSFPRRVRLIVGVRSVGGADQDDATATADDEQRPLADRIQRGLHNNPVRGRIQVDEAPWWVRDDMADYVTSLLGLSPRSPYYDVGIAAVRAVAEVVVDAAGKSFLFAKLAAEQLADRREVVDINDPAWRASLSQGVLGLFRDDLHRTIPDPKRRLMAVHLLRAVAFAFGPGLPWSTIWPVVASDVAGVRGRYGDNDIAWLLGTRLGGYLVTDVADGVTVYRLFHDDLRNILYERWAELLTP
jgi:hypothetical protein